MRNMGKIALSVTCALIAALCAPATPMASDMAATCNLYTFPKPSSMADLVLNDSSGQAVSIKSLRGKVVLLHFWSISCPACKAEKPLLQWLKKTYGPAGLEILAVNLVDPPVSLANYSQQFGFPVLFDGGRGFRITSVDLGGARTSFVVNPGGEAILEVPGLPTNYLLDKAGNVVAYSVGAARWNHQMAQAFMQRLLGVGQRIGQARRPVNAAPTGPARNVRQARPFAAAGPVGMGARAQ